MTREETLKLYDVNEYGIITSPSKFEGEMIYLPSMFEVYLDGFADEQAGGVLSVVVEKEDKQEYPELRRRKRVRFYVKDDGFVCEV